MFKAVLDDHFKYERKKMEKQRNNEEKEEDDIKGNDRGKNRILRTHSDCLYASAAILAFIMFAIYVMARMGISVPFIPLILNQNK